MQSIFDFFNGMKNEKGYIPDGKAVLPELEGNPCTSNWIPGAFEGILLRSNVNFNQPFFINYYMFLKFKNTVNSGSEKKYDKFCNSFMKYTAITMTDPLLSNMKGRIDSKKVLSFARKLLKETKRAELAKFAVALLGEYGGEEDLDDVKMFGSHEEFTLYTAVAVKNICSRCGKNSNEILLELASVLSGWGKIAIMTELDYSDARAKDFALKSGVKNDIAFSYLSNICAIKGKLLSYLRKTASGEAVLDKNHLYGICDIWDGFSDKSHPGNDGLTDYPEYAEAFDLFRQSAEKYGFADDERFMKIVKEYSVR